MASCCRRCSRCTVCGAGKSSDTVMPTTESTGADAACTRMSVMSMSKKAFLAFVASSVPDAVEEIESLSMSREDSVERLSVSSNRSFPIDCSELAGTKRPGESVKSRMPTRWQYCPSVFVYCTWNISMHSLLEQLSTRRVWKACAGSGSFSEKRRRFSSARWASMGGMRSVSFVPSRLHGPPFSSMAASSGECFVRRRSLSTSTTASQVSLNKDCAALS
mmetsp:Transcript_64530/g.151190  ORF Transcript_64530/g.151190 Transcript_64530/m.151190 type:complete len:219 (-) Transcript_64530:786-1442(-)